MSEKPRNPYPLVIRRLFKKVLPNSIYRRYVGRHEDESMRLWIYISANIHPDEAILDIGAFKGDYALAAREVNSKTAIYAFEPNPHSAKTLHEICGKKNIEVLQLAIAEVDGSLSFLLNSATSHIVNENVKSQDDIIQVPGISLDSWITENVVSPSLIKIDTEGAEAGILRGGKHLLMQHRPIILCEVLTDSAGDDVMEALPQDYIYYYINENAGIEEMSRITRKLWRNHNWLLVPKHRKSEICT